MKRLKYLVKLGIVKKSIFLALILSMVMMFTTGCNEESARLINDVLDIVEQIDTANAQTIDSTESELTISSTQQSDSSNETLPESEQELTTEALPTCDENGTYTSKEEVALYIHLYGHLPSNYITKKEAQDLGWDSSKGNLNEVAPGMSIGGDRFGNYEGLLPDADGRKWTECDIDYEGGYRGSKRIIFSNDGLIYYTEDHYASFELLYE